MSDPNERPLLKSARREAIAALTIWVIATTYCVCYCTRFAYGRDPASLKFILGFPDWIFWGIVVPWIVSVVVSGLFAFCFMKDEDLDD